MPSPIPSDSCRVRVMVRVMDRVRARVRVRVATLAKLAEPERLLPS